MFWGEEFLPLYSIVRIDRAFPTKKGRFRIDFDRFALERLNFP